MFAGNDDDSFHNDIVEEGESRKERPSNKLTADEMEFFDELNFENFTMNDEPNDEDDVDAELEKRKQMIDELDQRKGRGWSDPWEITDEDWMQKRTLEDLPDWTPALCSRISIERVKVYPDGIPTLTELAKLSLPPSPPPHPALGGAKAYAKLRKKHIQDTIYAKVVATASPKIPGILKLSSWDAKQNAIDELYESVEVQLKAEEDILGRSPHFGTWVEEALEKYLRSVADKNAAEESKDTTIFDIAKEKTEKDSVSSDEEVVNDVETDPVFMDLYDKEDGPKKVVPTILHPLKPHPRDGPGRMVEEWELAAHKETKRIMLRQCTQKIAQTLTEFPTSRVYVHGRKGTGKTAALAAITGSARKSGYIVFYLPDGDRLRQHGKYIEPNLKRKGIFDLPVLAQEVSEQLLSSHRADLDGMTTLSEILEVYFTEDQLKRLDLEEYTLVGLLEAAIERKSLASVCYAAVIHALMEQEEKPFLMVLDDFNCYYDYGKYYHMDYDEHVRNAIPCNQISLFKPVLDAMGISTAEEHSAPTATIKRGGIVVGTTESHAVARKFTDALSASAVSAQEAGGNESPLVVVDVPRYSKLESEHMISNMECIGIGRLRFDRGETVMNKNEMGYLRMVSGSVGQNLLDECVV
jgi:small subunit ribosomal protein S29